ncbi:MAG: TetR/AcrR family transcriptional regulator [Pygmaiobacter sp.]
MNTVVTSREAILRICRKMVAEQGLSALNMRAVAQQCNVALGSLYNYFPSKSELLLATIESVWQDIFHLERPCEAQLTFLEDVKRIFCSLNEGMVAYPNFLTAHSIGFAGGDRGHARHTMEHYFLHMKHGLLKTLKQDTSVRQDAFTETFTPEALVDFILSALLSLLVQRASSCDLLLEMLRRTLY